MNDLLDKGLQTLGAAAGDPADLVRVGGGLFSFFYEEMAKQRKRKMQEDLECLLAEIDQARPTDEEAFQWHRDRLEEPALAEMVAQTFERLRTTYDAATRYAMARLAAAYYVPRRTPDQAFRRCARFLEHMGSAHLDFALELNRHVAREFQTVTLCTIELSAREVTGGTLKLCISKSRRTTAEDIDPYRPTSADPIVIAEVAREMRQCGLADQPPVGALGQSINPTSLLFQKDAHGAALELLATCLVPREIPTGVPTKR